MCFMQGSIHSTIDYCQQLTVGCDPAVFAATGCCLLWVTALLVGVGA
jgi:hypothetical protein